MHVLLDDDLGRLTVRRLRPWHRWLARGLAARLDRQLAEGTRPESSAILAARAMFLTFVEYRRSLAASLRRILAAAAPVPPDARPRSAAAPSSAGAARPRLTAGPSAAFARQPFLPLRSRILAAAAPVPPDARPRSAAAPSSAGAARPRLTAGPSAAFARQPFLPLRRDRIARSASELAGLADFLAEQGPVPAQGVAMVSQLLADGAGPLYRTGSRDDLSAIIERASQALIR